MNKYIESYSSICQIIATGLRYLAFLAVVLIVLSLGAQVCFRYLLQLPLEHTDELAQTSLVWLTFIGAAALYREGGHVTVDCLSDLFSEQISRYLAITVEVTIGDKVNASNSDCASTELTSLNALVIAWPA